MNKGKVDIGIIIGIAVAVISTLPSIFYQISWTYTIIAYLVILSVYLGVHLYESNNKIKQSSNVIQNNAYSIGEKLGKLIGALRGLDLVKTSDSDKTDIRTFDDFKDGFIFEIKTRLVVLGVGKDIDFSLNNLNSWVETANTVTKIQKFIDLELKAKYSEKISAFFNIGFDLSFFQIAVILLESEATKSPINYDFTKPFVALLKPLINNFPKINLPNISKKILKDIGEWNTILSGNNITRMELNTISIDVTKWLNRISTQLNLK